MVVIYGPKAVDTAAEIVRINAIGGLVKAAASVVCLVSGVVSVRLIKDWDEPNPRNLSAIVLCAFGIVWFVISGWSLFDIWTWVALYNPKLALAHQILQHFNVTQ